MPKYHASHPFNDLGLAGESITIDVLQVYYILTLLAVGILASLAFYYWCMPTVRSYLRRWLLELDPQQKADRKLATQLAYSIRAANDKQVAKQRFHQQQQAEGSGANN